jgi:cation diffusion facilitator family transporter
MTQDRDTKILRIQQVAVGLGFAIMAVKFAAYYFTQSNTILTDALEAIVNILAGSFALYSLILSSKPKDIDHPYGHGKIEFIATGFEGGLIVLSSILIIWKSILGFFHPGDVRHLRLGMALITTSGIANYVIGFFLVRKARQYNSMVLDADGKHLKADGYISLGILIGVIVIWLTGIKALDNVFAIIAGICISYIGIRLMRKSLGGIMDETDTEIITALVAHLDTNRRDPWIDIHNMRVIQYGSTLHVDCHITMPWYYTLEQTHTEIENVSSLINYFHSYPAEVFVHPDPCLPVSCSICQMQDCPVRKRPFEQRVTWAFDNATMNKKHQLDEDDKMHFIFPLTRDGM